MTALAALAVGLVLLVRRSPNPPVAGSAIAGTAAMITSVLLLYRLLDPPDGLDPAAGVWLGLAATIAVGLGAYVGMQEDRRALADRRP